MADQIAACPHAADLSPRERAIVTFVVKVATAPATVAAGDFEPLRAEGLTDSDIWDAAAIAAFFSLSNRMASVADLRPNPEFYALGR